MRKQPMEETSNKTNRFCQLGFHRDRAGAVAWLSLIVLLASVGISAAQGTPTTQTSERLNALVTQLTKAVDPAQRIYAAEVLSQLGDRRATKPINRRSSGSRVRRKADCGTGPRTTKRSSSRWSTACSAANDWRTRSQSGCRTALSEKSHSLRNIWQTSSEAHQKHSKRHSAQPKFFVTRL